MGVPGCTEGRRSGVSVEGKCFLTVNVLRRRITGRDITCGGGRAVLRLLRGSSGALAGSFENFWGSLFPAGRMLRAIVRFWVEISRAQALVERYVPLLPHQSIGPSRYLTGSVWTPRPRSSAWQGSDLSDEATNRHWPRHKACGAYLARRCELGRPTVQDTQTKRD